MPDGHFMPVFLKIFYRLVIVEIYNLEIDSFILNIK